MGVSSKSSRVRRVRGEEGGEGGEKLLGLLMELDLARARAGLIPRTLASSKR